MRMEKFEAIVLGGGPVGMHAFALLRKSGVDVAILEASPSLGGQLEKLYPKKTVDDVKGYPPLKGHELFLAFVKEIDMARVRLNTKVASIERKGDLYSIATSNGEYLAKFVFLATGLGFYEPRKLGLEGEEKAGNILYSLKDPEELKGKRVAVFGGGDSALDWARELSALSSVSLVHRRDEFRGDGEKINGLPIDVYLSFVPDELELIDGVCKGIWIKSLKNGGRKLLLVDFVLVNFGSVPSIIDLPYPKSSQGFGFLSDENSMVDDNLFAIGDISYKEGKRKRMEPGFEEAERAIRFCLSRRG